MASGGQYFTAPGGLKATGNLSTKQFYIVKHGSTAQTVKVATTPASDSLLGVLQNEPTDGQAATVAVAGVCKVAAEASVAAGEPLTCSSTGRAKATTTDKDEVIGHAILPSVTAGDIIPMVLTRYTMSV